MYCAEVDAVPPKQASTQSIRVSVGIMAHNEAANIGALLEAVLTQERGKELIAEIVVVSSGSIDSTESIVRAYAERDKRIKLLVQRERQGKASAINLFLKNSCSEIVVLQSADTLPLPDTIAKVLEPFAEQGVGMSGARPVPSIPDTNKLGFAVHCMWLCHHLRNLKCPDRPKLGELVAFRRVFTEICEKTAVDEAEIEALIESAGLARVYCPEAVVVNGGPDSIAELFRQRYRIHRGNIDLRRRTGYKPLYGGGLQILLWSLRAARPQFNQQSLSRLSLLGLLACCEGTSYLLAAFKMLFSPEPPYVWKMIDGGKQPRLIVETLNSPLVPEALI